MDEFKIKNKFACFLQKNFQSKINLLNITNTDWRELKYVKKYLKSPQWLRDLKVKENLLENLQKIFK